MDKLNALRAVSVLFGIASIALSFATNMTNNALRQAEIEDCVRKELSKQQEV